MNVSELLTATAERLGEPPNDPVFYSPKEMITALNMAQRLFCLLTLSIERTASFSLTANTTFYTVSSDADFADFMVPLRVTYEGARVRPITIHQLDMMDHTWRSRAGAPEKYVQMGFNLLAVYKQTASTGKVLTVTYAATPAVLYEDWPAQEPEIDAAHHPALIEFARVWLRIKEGGQEMVNELPSLGKFLGACQKEADQVRNRSRGQQYDRVPFDLASFDQSRIMKMTLPKQRSPFGAQRQEAPQ